ncbi:MAG: bifunctional oligoribonuclease/PAP phosphatase NrnA [Phycisphaerales bacterium JB040]
MTASVEEAWATNTSLEELAAWLRDQRAVVLLTHQKPDGDAVGSTLAIARALNRASGTSGAASVAECWYLGPMPGWAQPLCAPTKTRVIEPGQNVPGALDPSAVLVCDTGTWNQLGDYAGWVRERRAITGVLDHHLQGDADMGTRRHLATDDAAVCQPAAELCRLILGLGSVSELPTEIAEPLYVGIATDTGWFRHSNVSADVMETAGHLLRAGVDHARLFEAVQFRDRAPRLGLMARALTSLTLERGETVAVMSLTANDFKQTGASPGDSGGFVDIPQSVPSVRVVALLTEQEDGEGVLTKLSLRSKAGEWNGRAPVDVNEVCQRLGGGGHARAAGARVRLGLAEAREKLLETLEAVERGGADS